MSVFNTLQQQAFNLARKALRIGSNFAHPVSDDRTSEADFIKEEQDSASNTLLSQKPHFPRVDEWGAQMPTTTFIDPETGLLTTKTESGAPLDEGTSIYDLYADRAARMGDEPLYTYKENNDWVTKTANQFLK